MRLDLVKSLGSRATMLAWLSLMLTSTVVGEPADEASVQDDSYSANDVRFTRRIAPLLRQKCLACHGKDPELLEGGLDLRTAEAAAAGGDSGEAGLVAGEPEQSSIWLAAHRGEEFFSAMPPKEAERLTEEELAWLAEWISSGADWPDDAARLAIEKAYADAWSIEDGVEVKTSGGLSPDWTRRKYDPADLWAYQPLRPLEGAEYGEQNPIDWAIERSLPDGLEVAPPAGRATLIRRASFDLTGLPPTPEEVADFVSDDRNDEDAFAAVVDRLLQSPHYGERMAQHWLDVVRYADSSGFANDYERGNAWRYRDYVIRSFNADKPYDQFVRQQIAGDELSPDDPESWVAVGFLRMGPWELTGMEVARVARQRFLDDVTNSVGETFLAHSLQCARCHDHKFDPIPTRDYYSIQAVFATTQLADRRTEFIDEENTEGFDEKRFLEQRRQAYIDDLIENHQRLLDNAQVWFEEKIAAGEDEFVAHRDRWDQAIAKAKSENRIEPFGYVRTQFLMEDIPQDQFPPKHVGLTPDQIGAGTVARKGMERLEWEMDRYEPVALSIYTGHTPNLKAVYAPRRVPEDPSDGDLEASRILTGGDPFGDGAPVQPSALSVLDDILPIRIDDDIDGRRAALARWITDPANPLTPRVIANRVWLWHFGKPLAANPNNFGATGGKPTHPELLDHLADRLIRSGWSIKELHRSIMSSRAYRRSSNHPDPDAVTENDPENRHYAVFDVRRLSAEEMRDAMLRVTGEWNPTLGGIPVRPEINREVALQPRMVMGTFAPAWVPNPKPSQRHRRSIYAMKFRGLVDPMMEVFNSPAPDFSCERRENSTITPQVFSLFNGQNTYSRALALAHRVQEESAIENDVDAKSWRGSLPSMVRRCFELTLGRQPSRSELDEFVSHWDQLAEIVPDEPRHVPPAVTKVLREAVEENTGERFTFEEPLFANHEFEPDLTPEDVRREVRILADLCLVLLNCNEFVYVF